MIKEMLETRKEQGRAIGAFLEKNPEWVLKHYEMEGRKALVISKGDTILPVALVHTILKYQKDAVLYQDRSNVGRSDCLGVTHDFYSAFRESKTFQDFRADYAPGFLSFAADPPGEVPAFYKGLGPNRKGFEWHQMNLVENRRWTQPSLHAAVDLSVHYNMDIEQGTMDVFIVIGGSPQELTDTLAAITGVPWVRESDRDTIVI